MTVKITANVQNKIYSMSQTDLVAALRSLAQGSADRTNMARLRDVFSEIEETIGAGVSVAKVHETLLDQGFKMKFSAFQSSLYRLRKERAAGKIPPSSTPTAALAADQKQIPASPEPSPMTKDGLTPPVWGDAKKEREAEADRYITPSSGSSIFRKKD